jgi:hypothetical protein
LRTRAYAQALLGRPLDQAALLAASADYESVYADYPMRRWNHFEEATYLEAIRLALLGGSTETAQRLLNRRSRFRTHLEEQALLRHLAASLTTATPVQTDGFAARFDAFFDQVRNPLYDPPEYSRRPILRLELALLREKYLISSDGHIDWQRAIDAIGE